MQGEDESNSRKLEPSQGRASTEASAAKQKSRRRKIDCCGNPEIADRRIEHRRGDHRPTSQAPMSEDDKLGG